MDSTKSQNEKLTNVFFSLDLSQSENHFTAELIEDNYFKWAVWFIGPPGTLYENGSFHAILTFPETFPNNPPHMRFLEDMWHPNIYPDGTVCISILHSPGVDIFNQEESADERWRPILGVESIMTSVMFMLGNPNLDSPANINAAIEMRDFPEIYRKKVRKLVESTLS